MIIKLVLYLFLTIGGMIMFKMGSNQINLHFLNFKINLAIPLISIVGVLSYGLSFLLWLTIVKDNELSFIFPVANGLVAVMTVVGGIIFFQEKLQPLQYFGIILIIMGVFIVNYFK